MPIKKSDYPANWDSEIVPAVRKRAGEIIDSTGAIVREARCEWCYVPNHAVVRRLRGSASYKQVEYAPGVSKLVAEYDWYVVAPGEKGTRIILTTAHLDRNRYNNDLSNLASLCQRCHLNHDRTAQHIPNRLYGKDHSMQPKLFD